MSEIEELLRQHTASVDTALQGFEGQVTNINEAIAALRAEGERLAPEIAAVRAQGDRVTPAIARLGGIVALGDSVPTVSAATVGPRLAIPDAERDVVASILRGRLTAAMRESSDPDGGILVPEVLRGQIEALVMRQSPMRRVARIVDFTSGKTIIPINKRGATAGWVGELEERTETNAPELTAVTPPGGTVYALPSASEELVDDAIVNLEGFIEENVVDAIAEKESQAFITGDGDRKPEGFLGASRPVPTLITDANRPFGSIQYLASDSPVTDGDYDIGQNLLATLVAMVFALKAAYRQAPGTAWLASTDLIARIARVKDGDGKPIYVPSLREGVPGSLLGYPVIEFEHMAGVLANSWPLAFGNWQRGYVIGDRTQLNILRDPYTTKGVIKWYFRKRVHGAVLNPEAIKLLKITAQA